jgi:hypothetical protein
MTLSLLFQAMFVMKLKHAIELLCRTVSILGMATSDRRIPRGKYGYVQLQGSERYGFLPMARDITHHDLGLGGGVIKMPDECGPHNQSLGSGFTVYYFVDSLEKVWRSP